MLKNKEETVHFPFFGQRNRQRFFPLFPGGPAYGILKKNPTLCRKGVLPMAGSYVWEDRKRIIFGLPFTFTTYHLTKEKLLIRSGILNTKEEEIRLYRIMDVTLNRSLWERLFGLGTIHCCSADKSTPEFDIRWIPHSADVKETLSNMIEEERQAKRVSSRECMTDEGDGDDDMM